MRDFSSIIGVASRVVVDVRHNYPVRGTVASQPVGNKRSRFGSLALQKLAKEAFRRTLIATSLNKDIEYVSVLVNSTPEKLSLTVDRDEDFVQIPSVAQSTLSSLQRTSILGTELSVPLSHGFI